MAVRVHQEGQVVSQESLPEKVTLEQKPDFEEGVSQVDYGGRAFQIEGIASKKAPKEECAGHV